MGDSDLYLATVDETIAANAIQDMASMNVALVVPQALKRSDTTEYSRHDTVIDFATFFGSELRRHRMPAWTPPATAMLL